MLTIDGSNGGGQILRTALSLSMITGKSFRMTNIRGQRRKPGLMRQHLTCVNASAEISGAATDGAELHSTELLFRPGKINASDYCFKIGSAGSTTLILQTLLPALLHADGKSTLELHGGTHNPMAPSTDFLNRSFLPQLESMGVDVELDCKKIGFAPAGGGCIFASIQPNNQLKPSDLTERGEILSQSVEVLLGNVREKVASDEIQAVKKELDWADECYSVRCVNNIDGSGNVLTLEVEYTDHTMHVTTHGEFNKSSQKVASHGVKALNTYLKSKAAIGVRLADQLLLPMALAGESSINTVNVTNHIKTNIQTIESFLDVRFHVDDSTAGCVTISV